MSKRWERFVNEEERDRLFGTFLDGTAYYRWLPLGIYKESEKEDAPLPMFKTSVHYMNGVLSDLYSFACPQAIAGVPCGVCKQVGELYTLYNDTQLKKYNDLARKIKVAIRKGVFLIAAKQDKKTKEWDLYPVKPYNMPAKRRRKDEAEEMVQSMWFTLMEYTGVNQVDLSDPVEGHWIKIRKEKTGTQSYEVRYTTEVYEDSSAAWEAPFAKGGKIEGLTEKWVNTQVRAISDLMEEDDFINATVPPNAEDMKIINKAVASWIEKNLSAKKTTDDDDDDRPAKKRPRYEEEDDDADERPAKKRVKIIEEEDDDADERPSKKKPKAVEEDEDTEERPSKKKAKVVEEDDADERPSKKNNKVVEDDDTDERPAKKRPRYEEDDDERPAKRKPKAVEEDSTDEKPVKNTASVKLSQYIAEQKKEAEQKSKRK